MDSHSEVIRTLSDYIAAEDLTRNGREMYGLVERLYPICRSITGDGVRSTLNILKEHLPLTIHEVPTGEHVFDWTIPREWSIKDAYIKDSRGNKIVEFKRLNLHVLNYSMPVHASIPLDELRKHLFTLPDHPDWIPYRTSYYKEQWGFCVNQRTLEELTDGHYEVFIDSSLETGHLTYGELYLPGRTEDEVLFSCHVCHPSLCNDNLSGVSLVTHIASLLSRFDHKYSYRFLFIPGTIGSITWLARNEGRVARIKHGLVVACVGDGGHMTYKKSRRGNAEIDTAVMHVLKHSGSRYTVREFSPYGYDERQYCSPGFNLPVGSLTRTPHGEFPEYHTSADNLDFVRPEYLADSLKTYLEVLDVLEGNTLYLTTNPKCEPQLGKRGLYGTTGGKTHSPVNELAMLWVLNQSDGQHSLLDIAELSGMRFDAIARAARALFAHGLLVEQ